MTEQYLHLAGTHRHKDWTIEKLSFISPTDCSTYLVLSRVLCFFHLNFLLCSVIAKLIEENIPIFFLSVIVPHSRFFVSFYHFTLLHFNTVRQRIITNTVDSESLFFFFCCFFFSSSNFVFIWQTRFHSSLTVLHFGLFLIALKVSVCEVCVYVCLLLLVGIRLTLSLNVLIACSRPNFKLDLLFFSSVCVFVSCICHNLRLITFLFFISFLPSHRLFLVEHILEPKRL